MQCEEKTNVVNDPGKGDDYSTSDLDRLLHCEGIWLHALRYEFSRCLPYRLVTSFTCNSTLYRYQGQDWSFCTEPPSWAVSDGKTEDSCGLFGVSDWRRIGED